MTIQVAVFDPPNSSHLKMMSYEVGTGGGEGSTILSYIATAAVGGTTFAKAGSYTGVSVVTAYETDGITTSNYNGVIGLTVIGASGGNTTFGVIMAAGYDPFTGVLRFTPF